MQDYLIKECIVNFFSFNSIENFEVSLMDAMFENYPG